MVRESRSEKLTGRAIAGQRDRGIGSGAVSAIYTNQAIAATTVRTAMPVVNAMARAKTTAIFFMIVSLFADEFASNIHRLAWLSSGPQPAEGAAPPAVAQTYSSRLKCL